MYKALLDVQVYMDVQGSCSLVQDQTWRQYFCFSRMLSLQDKSLNNILMFYLHSSSTYSFCSHISVFLRCAVQKKKTLRTNWRPHSVKATKG